MGWPAPHLDSLSALGTLRPWAPETCVIDEDYFPGGTPEGEPRRHTEVLGLVSHLGSLAREFRRALSGSHPFRPPGHLDPQTLRPSTFRPSDI